MAVAVVERWPLWRGKIRVIGREVKIRLYGLPAGIKTSGRSAGRSVERLKYK